MRSCNRTNPWEFGGATLTCRSPNAARNGASRLASCAARSSIVIGDPATASPRAYALPTSPPYSAEGPASASERSVRASAGWRTVVPTAAAWPPG